MYRLFFTALIVLLAGCEEEYESCITDRASDTFPADDDRSAQCTAVCEHMRAIGCQLGCPYLPDAGPDADPTSVETSELDCWTSCLAAVADEQGAAADALNRVFRCYAGAEYCRQIGACSRLCGVDGGPVWPQELLCTAPGG